MSEQDIERYVDASAVLVDLPIGAEYRAGVSRYFGLAAGLAELVMAHPLVNADEPAPAFVPVDAQQP